MAKQEQVEGGDKVAEGSEKAAASARLNEAADPTTRGYNDSIAAMRESQNNQPANDSLPNC
mgnify:CR=1 FL=1